MTWTEEKLSEEHRQLRQMLTSTGRMPQHVAVIMDGNGRWAQQQSKPRVEGHREGMESVRAIVKAASQMGVRHLTLYAFSIENWQRPAPEVRFLMSLLESYLKKEVEELHQNGVRIDTIGKTNALPKGVQRILRSAMERTAQNSGLHLTLALSYGSRWDITRAMQVMALDVRRGKLSPEDLTEEVVSQYLQTASTPDPDLVIRTSGEKRLSNFLLWECAYAEIYVTDTAWPDFRTNEFHEAIADYVLRERRFGKTSAQVQDTTLERLLHALR